MDATALLVDVRPVLEELGASVEVHTDISLPRIVVGSEEFDPVGPFYVSATVTNTGAGIVGSGTAAGVVRAVCSRCLVEFDLPVDSEIEGFYVEHGHDHDLPEEQDVEFVEGGNVDLMPAILSGLALELPFAPLHDPACEGICPTCGADRSSGECDCRPDRSTSPFAALEGLVFEEPGE